jgi:hypothetical protein
VVKVDTSAGEGRAPREMLRYPGVGHSAHGLVLYRQWFVLLDSDNGRLVAIVSAGGGPCIRSAASQPPRRRPAGGVLPLPPATQQAGA